MKRFGCAVFLCSLTVLVCGCSGGGGNFVKTEFVEGVVTLDGAPLDGALVTFSPTAPDGMTAMGYANDKGVYKLTAVGGAPEKGAVAGDYKVTVLKVAVTTVMKPPIYPGEPEREEGTQTAVTPERYLKADTTPLTATVAKGKNKIDFKLDK